MLADIVYTCDILICRRRVTVRNRGEIRGIIATCATLTVGTMKGSAVTWTATATRIACWACCLSTRRSPRRLPPAWRPRNIWDMLKMRTRSGMDIYICMQLFFLFPSHWNNCVLYPYIWLYVRRVSHGPVCNFFLHAWEMRGWISVLGRKSWIF